MPIYAILSRWLHLTSGAFVLVSNECKFHRRASGAVINCLSSTGYTYQNASRYACSYASPSVRVWISKYLSFALDWLNRSDLRFWMRFNALASGARAWFRLSGSSFFIFFRTWCIYLAWLNRSIHSLLARIFENSSKIHGRLLDCWQLFLRISLANFSNNYFSKCFLEYNE